MESLMENLIENIYVTKTTLPPFDEYVELLEKIWDSHFVTNDGPFFRTLEEDIKKYINASNLVCLANGTIALQLAYKALDLKGEVITTPFTHIATSSSLAWENLKPVYVDIDPETLNIDPSKIEEKITENTSAILPVHVYSNPCDCEAIESIAKKYNLKVIYDGAHAFGTTYKGKSVLTYGDITMASFNATKALNTIEGGALFVANKEMENTVRKLSFFGMENKNVSERVGTNAKMNEFCAAIGILNLKYFSENTEKRKNNYQLYMGLLKVNRKIRFQKLLGDINYSYVPIILESSNYKKEIIKKLNDNNIFPREYFSPSLEPYFSDKREIQCEISYDISNRILCLPMSDYLTKDQVTFICNIINTIN